MMSDDGEGITYVCCNCGIMYTVPYNKSNEGCPICTDKVKEYETHLITKPLTGIKTVLNILFPCIKLKCDENDSWLDAMSEFADKLPNVPLTELLAAENVIHKYTYQKNLNMYQRQIQHILNTELERRMV